MLETLILVRGAERLILHETEYDPKVELTGNKA